MKMKYENNTVFFSGIDFICDALLNITDEPERSMTRRS